MIFGVRILELRSFGKQISFNSFRFMNTVKCEKLYDALSNWRVIYHGEACDFVVMLYYNSFFSLVISWSSLKMTFMCYHEIKFNSQTPLL
jgi:hypothetical protein